jgi:branched-chain amino acid transport system permease protein
VVTIGLSQALIVGSLLVPRIWGTAPIGTVTIGFPWHLRVSAYPVVFNADYFVALILAPLALGGVALWSRLTDLGIATRATGDRRDRAAMLGIPVNRLQTVTWLVAGVLSFLSIFLKAAIVGLPLTPTFSVVALITALGALALGGFTDLPWVAASAVAIGILGQGVNWDNPNRPSLILAVLAAVVIGGLIMRRVGSRPERDSGAGWALVSGIRDTPARVAALPVVRLVRVAGLVIAITGAATLPLWLGPGNLLEGSTLLTLVIVGCSVVVLTGWSGQVSLGQMSFAAVGAAVGAVALADWHWDLSLALLIGGAAAASVATLVGLPTLRLNGIFVAVTTLAFALATSGYLLDRSQFGWIPKFQIGTPSLFGVQLDSEGSVFMVCLGVTALTLLAMHGLRSSRTGRVWRALSDNQRASTGFGVNVDRAKLSGFAVSGFIAGLAGCLLLVVNQQYVETPFDVTQSLVVFTATVVGGIGSASGAIAGAALVEGSAIYLPPTWQLFPSAAGVLLVLFAFPGGVTSILFRGRDRLLTAAAKRNRVDDDSEKKTEASPGAGADRRVAS